MFSYLGACHGVYNLVMEDVDTLSKTINTFPFVEAKNIIKNKIKLYKINTHLNIFFDNM